MQNNRERSRHFFNQQEINWPTIRSECNYWNFLWWSRVWCCINMGEVWNQHRHLQFLNASVWLFISHILKLSGWDVLPCTIYKPNLIHLAACTNVACDSFNTQSRCLLTVSSRPQETPTVFSWCSAGLASLNYHIHFPSVADGGITIPTQI